MSLRTGNVGRLVNLVFHCVQELTIATVIKCLESAIKKERAKKSPERAYVLQIVAQTLDISEKEICSGRGRKNERIYGLGFAAYYLHYKFKHDMETVQYMLNQDDAWLCYKYSKLIKELNPLHRADARYISLKKEFDKEIDEYKKACRGKKNKKVLQ